MCRAKIFLTAIICFSTLAAKGQDEAKLPFSERTGIKGITGFFGFHYLANPTFHGPQLFDNSSIDTRMSSEFKEDIARLENYPEQVNTAFDYSNKFFPYVKMEIVLAPFRLSAKPWKRNMEWTHGLLFQTYNTNYRFSGTRKLNDSITERYSSGFESRINTITYQTNLYLHFLITGNSMGYVGTGIGIGVPLQSYFRSVDATVVRYDRGAVLEESVVRKAAYYATEDFHSALFLYLGYKVHVSCRINIHAELAMNMNYHFLNTGHVLPDRRHGLALGVRYKFNRPPKEEGDEEMNKPTPFY